tara:strand:+ start:305 stop:478 length:174 start_codon:yes stop_codon:yes gene_type:complete
MKSTINKIGKKLSLIEELDKPLLTLSLHLMLNQARDSGEPFENVNKILKEIEKIEKL